MTRLPALIVAAGVLLLMVGGCAHAPSFPAYPGPAVEQPDLFRDCKPCHRVPPTSDGERGWCA